MDSAVPPQNFFVTQQPWVGFVGRYTLTQIRELIASGGLTLSHYVSEADGRSFAQFANERGEVRWMTIEQALVYYMERDKPNINRPSGSDSDNQGKFILLASLVNAELLKAGTFPLPPGTMAHPDVFGAVMSAMTLSEFSNCKEPGSSKFDPQLVLAVVQAATTVAKKNGWQSNPTMLEQLRERKSEDISNTTDLQNNKKPLISTQNTNSYEFLISSYKNTWWYKRRFGLMLFLFGVLMLFANYKLIGGFIFLLGLNILLVWNYKWFLRNVKNLGTILGVALLLLIANSLIFFSVFTSFNLIEFLNKRVLTIEKNNKIYSNFEIKNRLKESERLLRNGTILMGQEKYSEATRFVISGLKIVRETLGDRHPDTARCIDFLSELYRLQVQPEKVEPLLQEALKIRREVLGDKHPTTALSVNNLGLHYSLQAQDAKAEPLLLESIQIRKEVLGDKHPDTASSLHTLALLYYKQTQYAKAEPLFLEALNTRREVLGNKHSDTASSLHTLALLYYKQAQYAEAEPLFLEALNILREVLGNKHPDTATIISNLASFYFDQAQDAKAEPLFLEAIKIRKEILGKHHPDTIESNKNLAQLNFNHTQPARKKPLTAEQQAKLTRADKLHQKVEELSGKLKYAEATPLAIESLKIRREILCDKHHYTANSINNLGMLYYQQAQYAKAEPLYLEALKIRREVLGNNHPDTANSINNLGMLYSHQAQYAKAEPLFVEALKIRREVLGGKHSDTANSINSLAAFYSAQAQYAKAEPLYLEALKINKEILGNKSLTFANSINNLAMFYSLQAQDAKAEPLLLEAIQIRREVLGDKHPDTALSIGNLAMLYKDQAQDAKAEPLLLEVLKIRRETLGDKHPDTALHINNLALLYSRQAQYAKAEPLLIEALKIHREALGDKHPSTAGSINSLAWLYSYQAQYAKAEPLSIEALKIHREALGDKHPSTAGSINNLAGLYSYQAQYAKAEPLYLEALKISTAHLQSTSIIQSENAQILVANDSKYFLDSFLTNALANDTSGGGYDHVLSWKGMIYRRQNLLRALQGNDPLKKELSDTIRQLATLLNSTPKPNEEQAFQDKVKTLSDKKEELEKELAKQIPSLNLSKITPSDLQNLIAPDTALIDILQYEYSFPPKDSKGKLIFEDRYAAWVIRKDKPIVRLELGSAEDINNLVFQWRSSLSTRKSPSDGPQDPALALRKKVWLPIAKHLDGAKTVIISPDGALGTLPFTALPGEDIKKYLIEERNIAVVPFLQTLPELLAKKESTGIASMLALGDVAYDVEAISQSNTSGLLAVRGEKGAKWNRLPGTKAEVLSIENSFRKYFSSGSLVELNQNKASEQSVRESAPKSRYLHFATHGFFADETVKAMSVKQDDRKKMMGEKVVVTGENPGLLSGLVLAGANLPPKGNGDDGILTASEVAELDLTGVELAILSACETGLGKTAGGEGIFGLQRAFQLAGARTVVASSWKVPDLSTKELMVRFYGNLWEKKMGKLEALREAQLWVMKEGKAAGLDRGIDDESVVVKDTKKEPVKVEGSTKGEMLPPKYWAAWILSGAWKESNSEKKPTGMATKSEGTGVVMPVVRDLLVLPFSEVKAKEKQKEIAKNLQKEVEEKVDLAKEINLEMVLIPAGKFKMGEPGEDHEVTLTKPFYMGKYEVTQEQWEALMGKSPSGKIKGAKLPVTDVSWEDCQEFIKKLNAKTNGVYRLPTEAEWEYACRAGTATRYTFGEEVTPSDANFVGSKIGKPVEVGMYKPNAFGLYDMYGNVWEWCEDWYGIYPISAVVDPKGPATGTVRVLRGGSFDGIHGSAFGSSGRGGGSGRANRHGFRLARMADIKAIAAQMVPKSDPAKLKQEESNFTSIEKEMVLIPAGKFKMGSPATEKGRSNNETPHEVTLTKPFYIAKYEITQEQYESVMGNNPSGTKGAKLPVASVSWEDCQEFINKLNAKTNGGYRLPTEAEWEYACRAGTTTAYSFGDKITPKDANYFDSMIGKPIPVGVYKPNAFGLYDMHDNVSEWCEDWYGDYPAGPVTDPKGPATGEYRVLRGGSFSSYESVARSSYRVSFTPATRYLSVGFRLARTP